jgi:hypothetical protein
MPKMASFMSTIWTKITNSYPFQEYDFGIFAIFTYLFQHPPIRGLSGVLPDL